MYGRRALLLLASKTLGRQVLMDRCQVEQQAACVWTACASSLEDLGQAGVDGPLGVDCLPRLERDRGHVPDLARKTAAICLEVLLDLLNFTGIGSRPGKNQTEDSCLVSGSY